MSDAPSDRPDAPSEVPHEARVETLLTVLAGTIAMLPPQIAQLPPDIRRRVALLDQVVLAEWHHDVLLLRAELRAAREETAPEVLHGPPPA